MCIVEHRVYMMQRFSSSLPDPNPHVGRRVWWYLNVFLVMRTITWLSFRWYYVKYTWYGTCIGIAKRCNHEHLQSCMKQDCSLSTAKKMSPDPFPCERVGSRVFFFWVCVGGKQRSRRQNAGGEGDILFLPEAKCTSMKPFTHHLPNPSLEMIHNCQLQYTTTNNLNILIDITAHYF